MSNVKYVYLFSLACEIYNKEFLFQSRFFLWSFYIYIIFIFCCNRLLKEEQETDVTLCLGSAVRLKAHRTVLLARAPHLLQGAESSTPVIHLQNIEPAALRDILQYITCFLLFSIFFCHQSLLTFSCLLHINFLNLVFYSLVVIYVNLSFCALINNLLQI